MDVIKNSQSNKFAISLLYLKKRGYVSSPLFGCIETSKFLQVGITVFDGSGRTCPKSQNRKLVIFLQYIEKVSQLLLCYTVMQNVVPVMLFVNCLVLE